MLARPNSTILSKRGLRAITGESGASARCSTQCWNEVGGEGSFFTDDQ